MIKQPIENNLQLLIAVNLILAGMSGLGWIALRSGWILIGGILLLISGGISGAYYGHYCWKK